MRRPGFYEFFCGGGMARAGLGEGWDCLFANDVDAKKARAYADNWDAEALQVGDIHKVGAADLPGRADLAWASFPCQDLSLAGPGAGLDGARSGAFWGFRALMETLAREGRGPRVIALENVVGALTSNRGGDFVAICRALQGLGCRFGALTIDAAHFLPQSRPRLFFVAVHREMRIAPELIATGPSASFASATLLRAQASLPRDVAADWLWWALDAPPLRNVDLSDLIERAPADARWHSEDETNALVAILSKGSRAKLDRARTKVGRQIGAVYRRMRPNDQGGRSMRAEVRFDGVAGCLRTPRGGSSRQFLLIIEDGALRSRLITAREAARLMGLAEEYKLPARYNDAYHLAGDGVVVPIVRFLAANLLEPLLMRQASITLAAAE
ncbi:MAG TPA: DNA cytosine methyltransferase [Roseiarcus sp.]|nr:DNA cytosine methyltransferase [Roseiarcus sp.]